MYKKILVPLDGSPPATSAAKHAIQIAAKFDAEVTFFHVCPNFNFINEFSIHAAIDYTQLKEDFTLQGERILANAVLEYADTDLTIHKKLMWGYPSEEIIRESKDGEYDLIVTGSRGLSAIRGYLMGSVSNRVTKHAPCPVLVVR